MNGRCEKLRELLVDAAKQGQVCNYAPLGQHFGLNMENPQHRREIGEMLGAVSTAEVAEGRPMLSSIVVLAEGDIPSTGFYKLGRELGLVEPGEDEMAFIVRQMNATFAFWKTARVPSVGAPQA